VPLFFRILVERNDEFIPTWHEFRSKKIRHGVCTSGFVTIREQPFPLTHYVSDESGILTCPFFKTGFPTRVAFTAVFNVQTTSLNVFFNPRHHYVTRYTDYTFKVQLYYWL
jgi:hypothetical protein